MTDSAPTSTPLQNRVNITASTTTSTSSPPPPDDNKMYRTGVLVIPSVVHRLPRTLAPLLTTANEWVSQTLYVLLHPLNNGMDGKLGLKYSKDVDSSVVRVYERGSALCSGLDIRVLLSNVGERRYEVLRHLRWRPDVLIMDKEYNLTKGSLTHHVREYLGEDISVLGVTTGADDIPSHVTAGECTQKRYFSVCLGGTFDHLHNGHKVLLSQACLVSQGKVTVGVTDHVMHKNKVLVELMQSTQERVMAIEEFLNDVKPRIDCEVLPITDAYGPTIHRAEMDCLVVSQETLAGGKAVNTKRAEKGYPPMTLEVIDVMDDIHHNPGTEETKLSSTSTRRRLLGTRLRQKPLNTLIPLSPYIVGMTGRIASGKSSICQRLAKLGAGVINCDKLGHEAYKRGTEAYRQIVKTFGEGVLTEGGDIDRRKLGEIVFSDKEKLNTLNQIVWPAIRQLAVNQISEFKRKGVSVVILDAAVLLEAGWDDMVHEVWVATLPESVAVERIVSRDGLSEEEARKRVTSQTSDDVRVASADVVLTSRWEPVETQRQVEKAWNLLQERLSTLDDSHDVTGS